MSTIELTAAEALAAGRAMFEREHAELKAFYGSDVTTGTKVPVVGEGWAKLPPHLQQQWVERAKVAWNTVIGMRVRGAAAPASKGA